MSTDVAIRRSLLVFLALGMSFALTAAAETPRSLASDLRLISTLPIHEAIQGHQVAPGERTTVYIYDDRVEYYDNALVAEIESVNQLPATSPDGVLYTELFLTQFHSGDDLYIVQRGWNKDGNCRVTTTKLGPGNKSIGQSNTCSGDPCSYCNPFDPDNGCQCRYSSGHCNHSTEF